MSHIDSMVLHTPPLSVLAGGTSDFLAVAQKFPLLQSADNWLPFTHEGTQYLLQLSDAATDNSFESSRLYQWKGSFVLVQNLSTSGASAGDSFTATSGRTYVAVANAGSSSNRSVDSVIYEVVDGQLIQVLWGDVHSTCTRPFALEWQDE